MRTAPSAACGWLSQATRANSRLQVRQEFLLPDLRRHRTNSLLNDLALRADQEALGCTVHAPVDGDAAIVIGADGVVGIAELLQPGLRIRIVVLPVDADDRHLAFALDEQQRLVLGLAFETPGAPHIYQ